MRGKFITDFKALHTKVSKQYDREIKTEIIYQSPGNNQEKYIEKLDKRIKRDLVLGRTEHGPHRDDVTVMWSGRNIKTIGSQGEHKLCLILLKLAVIFLLVNKINQ